MLTRKQHLIFTLLLGSGGIYVLYKYFKSKRTSKKDPQITQTSSTKDSSKPQEKKSGLSKDFWRQLSYLLKISVPKLKSPEFLIMIAIAIVQIGVTVTSNTESRVEGNFTFFLTYR